jgi:hypothetical protein
VPLGPGRGVPEPGAAMIDEVDEALAALVRRDAVPGAGVDVVFDAPTKDWAARRNAPTISLFLYDLREDVRRRTRGLLDERGEPDADGVAAVTARRPPPRWFKLSYLATAWTARPEDEHRLLSALLRCTLAHEKMPDDLLPGSLAELGLPVPLTVGLPPPEDRSFADVWSALGGELKPSLDIVVNVPVDTTQLVAAGPPVTVPPRLRMFDRDSGFSDEAGGAAATPAGRDAARARPAADGLRLAKPKPARVAMKRRRGGGKAPS